MSTPLDPRDHLRPLDQSLLNDLLEADAANGPYLSLYLPTEKKGADTRKNGIRFKSLLKSARDELASGYGDEAGNLVAGLEGVGEDNQFWQHQTAGLAVFQGGGKTYFVRLGRPVEEKAAVADSFHVKPLVRLLQDASRYQLLAVTQKTVTLYEGDLDSIAEVPLHADVPNSVIDALGGQVRGHLNVNSYGGMAHSGMFHGHHDNSDDRDNDLDRFFRAVDKAVYDYHGRGGELPLYFAGVTEYHDRFFKASHHPRLVKAGPRVNPDAVEVDEARLLEEMRDIIRPAFEKQVAETVEQFGTAKAQQQGSDDVAKVAEAAVAGRVQTLLVDADKSVGGRIDPETGQFKKADENDADVDDVLDDLAERVLRTGGKVRVLAGENFPSSTGVAAIFRY